MPPLAPTAPSSVPSRYTGTAPVCGVNRPQVIVVIAVAKIGIDSILVFCPALGMP